jgi:hypothetical protein
MNVFKCDEKFKLLEFIDSFTCRVIKKVSIFIRTLKILHFKLNINALKKIDIPDSITKITNFLLHIEHDSLVYFC